MIVETRRLTRREVLEIVLPKLVDAMGDRRVRALHKLVLARLGKGGTTADWLRAWGEVLAAEGDTLGAVALLQALDEIGKTP